MTGAPAVRIRELTVAFDGFVAVDRISLQVGRGEIFGFLGANGAGKTTTIRVLCGLLLPTSGHVEVDGIDVTADPRAVKAGVGYMSQRFTLYDDMTIAENLAFAAALRKIPEGRFEERVAELTGLVEVDAPFSTRVRDLPAGVLQQVALTASILHDPPIVFLDEPTAGVTPAARERFWQLIRRLAGAHKTVFVTTHYMDEAEQCDRIALMRTGSIIALGSPAELKQRTFPEPILELTPPADLDRAWVERLRGEPWVGSLNAYGMHYHLRPTDAAAWEAYRSRELPQLAVRRIDPSLEDVFIRLVEGEGR